MGLGTELMSVTEAAKVLNLTSVRVGVLCRQGRFSGAAKIGPNWIIPRVSVENFKRLPPGAKPKTAKRKEDEALIKTTPEQMKGEMNNAE